MQLDIKVLLTLHSDQALSTMNSSLQGLTSVEATSRRVAYGRNEILKKPARSLILDAISHSTNPLIAILVIAAVVSAFTGSLINTVIVITVVSLSVIVDYFQTHRSLLAVTKLQEQVATTVDVLRDGLETDLFFSELVPGNIIDLVAGARVPVDCLLLHAKDLHVQH